jgi:hypothetical protein
MFGTAQAALQQNQKNKRFVLPAIIILVLKRLHIYLDLLVLRYLYIAERKKKSASRRAALFRQIWPRKVRLPSGVGEGKSAAPHLQAVLPEVERKKKLGTAICTPRARKMIRHFKSIITRVHHAKRFESFSHSNGLRTFRRNFDATSDRFSKDHNNFLKNSPNKSSGFCEF